MYMYAIMPHACAHNARHAGNTNAQCMEINIPKRDQRTYIHTDAKPDAKQD